MSREIIRRSPVEGDLYDLAEYISRDDLDAAIRFLDAVEETFRFLAESSDVGNPCHFRRPTLAGMKRWHVRGFPKHLIFYFATEDEVEIVRVLHAARDWQSILDR